MAKMKYSEIPRDLSSDSVAAFRLAHVIISFSKSRFLLLQYKVECGALSNRVLRIETSGKDILEKGVEEVPNLLIHPLSNPLLPDCFNPTLVLVVPALPPSAHTASAPEKSLQNRWKSLSMKRKAANHGPGVEGE